MTVVSHSIAFSSEYKVTMAIMFPAVLLLLVCSVPITLGYPSGPPQSSCTSMFPGHGVAAQTSTSPYTVTVSQTNYATGDTINVTIQGSNGATFRGFILQARRADWAMDQNEPIGTFQNVPSVDNAKLLTCENTDDSFCHSSAYSPSGEHSAITIQWLAPTPSAGHIVFRATVAEVKNTFWNEIYSDMVEDPTAPTIGPTPAVTQGDLGERVTSSDCGDTKGCYMTPAGCTGKDDCDILISWQEDGNNVIFQLLGKMRAGEEYVAIGFSNDQKMGDDDVWGCIEDGGGTVTLSHSFNPGYSNSQHDTTGSSDFSGSYTDGVIQCQFKRQKSLGGNKRKKRAGENHDLSSPFYILVARGPKNPSSPPGLSKHIELPIISAAKIDFTRNNIASGAAGVDPKLKSHACLMIIGWIGCASIGIMFARYFKPIWPNSQLLGQKVWFTFHRSLMILNLLCFIVAFILIFIYVGGFVTFNKSSDLVFVHALSGIIVTALGLTNPIMAFFRPHPGAEKRVIFNWAHWGVGTASHILAIATVFIGMDLAALDLPQSATWVLLAFVCIHVIIELLLEVATCVAKDAERKEAHEIPLHGVTDKGDDIDDGMKPDPPGSLIRINLLALYGFVVFGVVIYLVVLICLK
ncbi:putative ferric-chelate reductase 1 [Glandiceps talaboti]